VRQCNEKVIIIIVRLSDSAISHARVKDLTSQQCKFLMPVYTFISSYSLRRTINK